MRWAQAQGFRAALPPEEPALALPPRVALALREVGITTAGALAALPAAALALRFGPETVAAWRRAGGREHGADRSEPPLRSWQAPRVLAVEEHWEEGIEDRFLLEARLARLCGRLAAALAEHALATAHLVVRVACDDGSQQLRTARCWEPLAPSAPLERTARTLLAQVAVSAPVTELALEARDLGPPQDDQLGLWDGKAVTRRRERLEHALDAHARAHPSVSFTRLRRDPLAAEGWRWESREQTP
jgi:protein ImuB